MLTIINFALDHLFLTSVVFITVAGLFIQAVVSLFNHVKNQHKL